ncbi:MAG: hypothetical protein ABJB05_12040 [Parafilimonas sp.]
MQLKIHVNTISNFTGPQLNNRINLAVINNSIPQYQQAKQIMDTHEKSQRDIIQQQMNDMEKTKCINLRNLLHIQLPLQKLTN